MADGHKFANSEGYNGEDFSTQFKSSCAEDCIEGRLGRMRSTSALMQDRNCHQWKKIAALGVDEDDQT